MKNFTPRFFTIICLLSFFMQGCHNKEAILNNLSHRWLLDKGFRNEKETDSLTGLYFDFNTSGEVTTNLNGQDERLTFKLNGEDVIELNGTESLFLNIVELSESKLVLQTNIQGYTFKFELLKEK
jgi:hypothetical protein